MTRASLWFIRETNPGEWKVWSNSGHGFFCRSPESAVALWRALSEEPNART